ncbi:hypothetical protein V6N12_009555 [Hibiscus sabdariffa]|uniref:Uncharacterized protein n=1 Tax=Hibiscus sabdariffa TaxID=183260 RepID=A0ABR2AUD0_9ROSI
MWVAARRQGDGVIAYEGAIRDDVGGWRCGFARLIGVGSVVEAKLWAIYDGHMLMMRYELQNLEEQIQTYVFDVVRALVPKMNLDDLFEQKGEVAKAVLDELGKNDSREVTTFRRDCEDMVELDDDDHGNVDPSIRLTVASSTEMDLVRDSIRDQIVEHMKLN